MQKRNKRYTEEFKEQIVKLYTSGKKSGEIAREYGVSKTSVRDWTKKYHKTGSFKLADNISDSEKELRSLRKENKHLRMENDILKQAR